MASRNYYVILGVPPDETDQGLRTAFRELAKRLHPDRVGPSGIEPFREIVEAYETLTDVRRRHEYDESLRRASRRSIGDLARDVSLRRHLVDVRPSEEALFDRFAHNFTGVARKGERVEALRTEVAISEEEAGRGTQLQLNVPFFARCMKCFGQGCFDCRGQGVTESERPVAIDVPPMSGAGTTFVLPLTGLGIHNFFLRVRVRIDKSVDPQP
jgi:DnaJ-class molecular chaperone